MASFKLALALCLEFCVNSIIWHGTVLVGVLTRFSRVYCDFDPDAHRAEWLHTSKIIEEHRIVDGSIQCMKSTGIL